MNYGIKELSAGQHYSFWCALSLMKGDIVIEGLHELREISGILIALPLIVSAPPFLGDDCRWAMSAVIAATIQQKTPATYHDADDDKHGRPNILPGRRASASRQPSVGRSHVADTS